MHLGRMYISEEYDDCFFVAESDDGLQWVPSKGGRMVLEVLVDTPVPS